MSSSKLSLTALLGGLIVASVSISSARSNNRYELSENPTGVQQEVSEIFSRVGEYKEKCGNLTISTDPGNDKPESSPRRSKAEGLFGKSKRQYRTGLFRNGRCIVDKYVHYNVPVYITGCVAIDGTVCEEIKIDGEVYSSRCELPSLGHYEGPFNKKSGIPGGGRASLELPNGDTYRGDFKNGLMHGYGDYAVKTPERENGINFSIQHSGYWVRGVIEEVKRSEQVVKMDDISVMDEETGGISKNRLPDETTAVHYGTVSDGEYYCRTEFVSGVMHGREECTYMNVFSSLKEFLSRRGFVEHKYEEKRRSSVSVVRTNVNGVLDRTAFITDKATLFPGQITFEKPKWKITLDRDGKPVGLVGRVLLSKSLYRLGLEDKSYGSMASRERYMDIYSHVYREKQILPGIMDLEKYSIADAIAGDYMMDAVRKGIDGIELCNYKGDDSKFTYFPAIRVSERYARGYIEGGESVELEPLTVDYEEINRILTRDAGSRTLMEAMTVPGGSKIEFEGLRKYSDALIRDGLIASPVLGFNAEMSNPLVNLVTLANLEDPKSRKKVRYQGLMEDRPLKESYRSVVSLLNSLGIYDDTVRTIEESYIVTSLTLSRETPAIVNLIINIKGLRDVLGENGKLEDLEIDEKGTMTMAKDVIYKPLFYAYDPVQIVGYGGEFSLGRIGANIEHSFTFVNKEKHMNHGNWLNNAAFNILAAERSDLIENLFGSDVWKAIFSEKELEREIVVTMEKMIEKTPGCSISAKTITVEEEKKFKNGEIKNVVRSLMFFQNSTVIKHLEEEASEKEALEKEALEKEAPEKEVLEKEKKEEDDL